MLLEHTQINYLYLPDNPLAKNPETSSPSVKKKNLKYGEFFVRDTFDSIKMATPPIIKL